MTALRERPFAGAADFDRLLAFASAHGRDAHRQGYLHIGDICWRAFQHTSTDLRPNVRLWATEAGELAGYAWFWPPNAADIQVAPAWRGRLEDTVLAWVECRRQAEPPTATGDRATLIDCLDGDTTLVAALTARGYTPGAPRTVVFEYDLSTPPVEREHGTTRQRDGALGADQTGRAASPGADTAAEIWPGDVGATGRRDILTRHGRPSAPLAAGDADPSAAPDRVVRPIDLATELDARVALHRVVWAPSRFTAEGYAAVRASPAYRADLDLVAVAPDGCLAAYTIVWYDAQTGLAEFEPFGTHPDYRRQGYGRALVHSALRQLHRLGARRAFVMTSSRNTAAQALYAAAGGVLVARWRAWSRTGSL